MWTSFTNVEPAGEVADVPGFAVEGTGVYTRATFPANGKYGRVAARIDPEHRAPVPSKHSVPCTW